MNKVNTFEIKIPFTVNCLFCSVYVFSDLSFFPETRNKDTLCNSAADG